MKIIKTLVLHLVIILIVIIFPVIVYEFMSKHEYYDFAFFGGISYFIYAFYLVLKIKNHRTKIILLGILSSLLAFSIGLNLIDINELILIISLTINLIFQTFLLIKNSGNVNQAIRKSYLINFVITLTLSIPFLFLWFLAVASSGMPANHY